MNTCYLDYFEQQYIAEKSLRTGPRGLESDEVRWPDALSFGPDGWLYLADSALPDLILQSREHIEAAGPYRIYRFQPGFEGVPGQ